MSSANDWQDRRGIFQTGKEVHEPGRKLSNSFGDPIRRSSIGSDKGSPLEKTTSTTSAGGSSPDKRRRVSIDQTYLKEHALTSRSYSRPTQHSSAT